MVNVNIILGIEEYSKDKYLDAIPGLRSQKVRRKSSTPFSFSWKIHFFAALPGDAKMQKRDGSGNKRE